MRCVLSAFALLVFTALATPCNADPRLLTEAEAHQLVISVLRVIGPGDDRLPGFEIDSAPAFRARNFVIFEAEWAGNGGGSNIASFEVNMRTADIFSALFCKEFKGGSIRRKQIELRRAMKLDAASYRKYRSGGDYC